MSAAAVALRGRLTDALEDARRVYEADRSAGVASSAFASGRYDGLKQALEILEEVDARRG